jgi:hypothetical protein
MILLSSPNYVSWTLPIMVEYVLQMALCKLGAFQAFMRIGKNTTLSAEGFFLFCCAVTLVVHPHHPPYSAVFLLTLCYRHEINIRAFRILEMVFQQLQAHLHENLPWIVSHRHNFSSYLLVICVLFSRGRAQHQPPLNRH